MLPNETILLSFRVNGDELILRTDRDGMAQFEASQPAIYELTLKGWQGPNNLLDDLHEGIDKTLEYDIYQDETRTFVTLYIDYSTTEVEVECTAATEVATIYTAEDWRQKSRRLAEWYEFLYEKSEESFDNHYRLIKRLEIELSRDIDRSERKVIFFDQKNPIRAAMHRGQIQTCQKVLDILKQSQRIKLWN